MKKVLFSLGVAVLFTVLLTAPAMARPFYQSNLVCDLNKNTIFYEAVDALAVRPYTVIGSARDLYVKLVGLPTPSFVAVGAHLFGEISCFDQGFVTPPIDLGEVEPGGKLVFLSGVGVVPTPCSDIRVDISDSAGGPRRCTEGF
jgi:hypothetical protein